MQSHFVAEEMSEQLRRLSGIHSLGSSVFDTLSGTEPFWTLRCVAHHFQEACDYRTAAKEKAVKSAYSTSATPKESENAIKHEGDLEFRKQQP